MKRLVLLAGLVLLVSGCASRASVHQLETDLGAAKKDIAALRESQDRTEREGARMVADVKSLQERLREVQGSLGEATTEVARLRSRIDAAEEAIKKTRADLDARPEPVAAAPAPPPAPEKPREVPNHAAEAAFNQALTTFRAREHGQAVLDFLDFIAKYPKHPLASSAQFWIAEAYFVQRDYRQALTEYQKVLEAPGSPKAPDALLKIAQCYTTLREPLRAQETLQQLVRDFPQSEPAARARRLLRARATR
jgi:tol-pal system protein YbgF